MGKWLAVLSVFLFSVGLRAENCADVKTCSKLMYDLKGQRYLWNAKMEENRFGAVPDVELTKDNAELVFTALLDHLGLARVPVGDGKTFRVEKSPNRKEMEMPIVDASASQAPELPPTWDWVTMRYKLKSPEEATFIESAYRLHVPREARMQADENAGLLIVQGPAPLVRHMYEMVKAADKPLTAGVKEHLKQWEKRDHERRMAELQAARAPNPPPIPPSAMPPPPPPGTGKK